MIAPFKPARGLANRHVQSILTSSALRRIAVRRRAGDLIAASRSEIVTTPQGVRLTGWRTPAHGTAVGLTILLHGWEGSASSNYLLSAANALWQVGFEVFRLNFRDHGDSHHLNRELFHSCRLEEVVEAVALLAQPAAGPVTLTGFSLGGNFALRVALAAPGRGIPLARVIAVCPVIRPGGVLDALERGLPFYERYFERKWRRSLDRKQASFPADYDFSEWFTMRGLRAKTRYLIERHTDFSTLDDYLDGYTLSGDRLAALRVPATIVAAADDPVVPADDFTALTRPPAMQLHLEAHGGHCGFLANWRLESWIDGVIARTAARRQPAAG